MKEASKTPKMEAEVRLRIVLIAPPAGVDFGIQEGKGSDYITIHKQRSKDADLTFEFTVTIKDNRDDGLPNFLGPLAQGPTTGRFIYIDIGKSAGQFDSCWVSIAVSNGAIIAVGGEPAGVAGRSLRSVIWRRVCRGGGRGRIGPSA